MRFAPRECKHFLHVHAPVLHAIALGRQGKAPRQAGACVRLQRGFHVQELRQVGRERAPVLELFCPPFGCTQQRHVGTVVSTIAHFIGNASQPPMTKVIKVNDAARLTLPWSSSCRQAHVVVPVNLHGTVSGAPQRLGPKRGAQCR